MTDDDKQLQAPSNPLDLLTQAVSRGVDVETIRELMNLEREWRADKARAAYAQALAQFGTLKKPIPHNRKGKTAGNAEFSYADFPQMEKHITPWLSECGLSFSHYEDPPVFDENGKIAHIMIYCRLAHEDGHYEVFPYPAMPDPRLEGKVSPSQLIQLAITYAKRQSLAMATGVATADDKFDSDSEGHRAATLTEEQAADLHSKVEEYGFPHDAVLKWLKVDTYDDLLQINLKTVYRRLKERYDAAQQNYEPGADQ